MKSLLERIDATREMRTAAPEVRAVLLTVHADDPYVLAALKAGVKGYVLKTQAAEDLVQAIQAVLRGETYLSPGISNTVVAACLGPGESVQNPPTPRERQVLQLVAEGKTTRALAEILSVSVKTAESHRTRLMKKLGIHDTAGLVRYAIRHGLIEA